MGLAWREDSSNASLKYRRNLWRLELQPFLRDQVPTIDQFVALLQKQFALEIQSQENAKNTWNEMGGKLYSWQEIKQKYAIE